MAGVRFEDVELLGALSRIVDLHTQHYKEDFDLDKELISKLAVSDRSEDKQLLWMSRPCGTYTLREREVYLDGSHENKVWRFYQEQTNDPVLAYAISLKEVRDGKIFGDLYPLNYREHVEQMKKLTCPIGNVAVAFEDGNVITIPYQERRQLMNRLMPEHGVPKTMTYLPENEPELMMILKRERFKRSYHATAGNLEEYLDKLEKTTLREKLKRAKTVVSTQEVSSHKRTMKGGHNKKSVRAEFVMSEPEAELVKERMAELGITNLSAYLRKMAVDGYIIHLDMGDIQEMIRLLRICSNNLNQYTRRANETGNIYAADIDDIRTRLDSLWDGMDKLIRGFANIS